MSIQLTIEVFKDTNISEYETYFDFVYCDWTNKDLMIVAENFCDLLDSEFYEECIPPKSNPVRGLTQAEKKKFAIGIYDLYSEEFESAFSAHKLIEREDHEQSVKEDAGV
jgi:hypothetical protein